ncbi:hypothetical protein MJG53_012080 [Ovis ammon polii x Ovis aries]|uniref:Uncharacterized protein n=1 Tax=Ovis ammon polii x Ovis aries TaxID=2918886 RepID=A0ACB9UQI1_9CETA|nr:hypothetical protein MJG53_012080 [Ovis ammon polii x Ovis aries]
MPIKSSSLKDEYQNQQIEDYENKSCQPALVDYQALYESMSTFRQNPHQTKYQELSVFVQHHECDDCSMAFSCSSQLAEHQRIHQVEKAPRDDEEAKAFRHRASFTRLQSVDTLDKHFECDQCGETFNRASKFIQHQSTHSRLKPHKCDVCPRAFQFLSSLITHQRFHAGKSPRLAQHQRTPERNKLFISAALLSKHRLNEASKRSARWKAFQKMQFLNSGMKSPQGGVCQGSRDITNTEEASSAHEPRTLESSVTPPETKHRGKRYELQLLK